MSAYPANTVWMIETRFWPDSEDDKPGEEHPWKRYAPMEPSGFGSGVVIQLEQLSHENKPLDPPSIKNYLLTCGHVVRAGDTGAGPLAKEIICWKPDMGYHRTLRFNAIKNEGRLKGQMEGGYLAAVSTLSPYDGRKTPIPEEDFKPHLDWALLEVCDVEERPAFDVEDQVGHAAKADLGTRIRFIGYPDGAGWEKQTGSWKLGANFLTNGDLVQPFLSDKGQVDEVAAGMLTYRGTVELRPGMSGGGVFRTRDNALVGLHRSRHDPSLKAQALEFEEIVEWLRIHRHVRPVFRPPPPTGCRTWAPLKVSVSIVIGMTIIGLLCVPLLPLARHDGKSVTPPVPVSAYVWRGQVVEWVDEGGVRVCKPVDGAKVTPKLKYAELTDLAVTTPHPSNLGAGLFEIYTNNKAHWEGDPEIIVSKEGYESLSKHVQASDPAMLTKVEPFKITIRRHH